MSICYVLGNKDEDFLFFNSIMIVYLFNCSERTRLLLTSAAYVHLKEFDISKHTRNLAPASRAILLSGPAELYQQMLAKALSHYFESKLLLLDVTDFSIKVNQSVNAHSFFSIVRQNSS